MPGSHWSRRPRRHARAGRARARTARARRRARRASPRPPPPPRRASEVVLVDERAKLGGQYYKQPSDGVRRRRGGARPAVPGRPKPDRAASSARASTCSPASQVWGADGPAELLARRRRPVVRAPPAAARARDGRVRARRAAARLDASRSHDDGRRADADARLPGASRAPRARLGERPAQHPGRGRDRPRAARGGRRSASSRRSGARVEPARSRAMLASAPGLSARACGYGREPPPREASRSCAATAIVRAEGDGAGRARRRRAARRRRPPGARRASARFDVDAVCAGFGFLPSNELARTLGLRHEFDPALGQLVAVVDERDARRSTGVWVVGDGGGTGGARLAQGGRLPRRPRAARSLGRDVPALSPPRSAGEARPPRGAAGSSAGSWRLFAAPRLVDQLAAPDTLVCRCEERAARGGRGVARGRDASDDRRRQARDARRDGPLPGPLLRAASSPGLSARRIGRAARPSGLVRPGASVQADPDRGRGRGARLDQRSRDGANGRGRSPGPRRARAWRRDGPAADRR